jgi:hypothetical protein
MEPIKSLFRMRAKRLAKRTSERGDLLEYFTAEANRERRGKYKALPVRFYAVKLSHLKTADLYYLKSVCEDAQRRGGSWAKCFWGSLKIKDAAQPQ